MWDSVNASDIIYIPTVSLGLTTTAAPTPTQGVPSVVLVVLVLAAILTLGVVITCIVNHYRMGARPWSDTRSPPPPDRPQTTHTVQCMPTAMESASFRDRDLRALHDRQVRLHSVQTDLQLRLPPSLPMPDGEEVPYGSSTKMHIRDGEQQSEISRECVRAPPNRTVCDGESPPPYHPSPSKNQQTMPLVIPCHGSSHHHHHKRPPRVTRSLLFGKDSGKDSVQVVGCYALCPNTSTPSSCSSSLSGSSWEEIPQRANNNNSLPSSLASFTPRSGLADLTLVPCMGGGAMTQQEWQTSGDNTSETWHRLDSSSATTADNSVMLGSGGV